MIVTSDQARVYLALGAPPRHPQANRQTGRLGGGRPRTGRFLRLPLCFLQPHSKSNAIPHIAAIAFHPTHATGTGVLVGQKNLQAARAVSDGE